MTQKINKESDLMLSLILKDKNGTPYRIGDLMEFSMIFYTSNPDNHIEVSYKDGEYKGITIQDDNDFIALNSSDIKRLDDGNINYQYHIRYKNDSFNDGFFDEVISGQTDLYLKSNKYNG